MLVGLLPKEPRQGQVVYCISSYTCLGSLDIMTKTEVIIMVLLPKEPR